MNLLNSLVLGEGSPLIILHGFLGMLDNWKGLGMQYANKGFEVHLLDQRNHGKSFHSSEFDYKVMVDDLKNYMDFRGLNKAALLGHSMGGKTVMFFAVTYPNRVSKLLVADISPRYYAPHHQSILEGLSLLYHSHLSSRVDAEYLLSKHVEESSIRMFLLKNLYRDEATSSYKLRLNFPVLSKKVDEIGKSLQEGSVFLAESMFLRGEHSNYINSQDEEDIKKIFFNVKISTLKGAGHWLHVENPSQFWNETFSFLKN